MCPKDFKWHKLHQSKLTSKLGNKECGRMGARAPFTRKLSLSVLIAFPDNNWQAMGVNTCVNICRLFSSNVWCKQKHKRFQTQQFSMTWPSYLLNIITQTVLPEIKLYTVGLNGFIRLRGQAPTYSISWRGILSRFNIACPKHCFNS